MRFKLPVFLCLSLLIIFPLQAKEQITGTVQSGAAPNDIPIAGAEITLYQAGSARKGKGSRALVLGKTYSEDDGAFSLLFSAPDDKDAVLYLIAKGESKRSKRHGKIRERLKSIANGKSTQSGKRGKFRNPLKFAAVLGTSQFPAEQDINELTTVATAYAMAQFIEGNNISGSYPGLQNAASMVFNLADNNGQDAEFLTMSPNGSETTTLNQFNSLANMLAACSADFKYCKDLAKYARDPKGPAPRNTLQAMVNIAHNPWQNVPELFEISQQSSVYEPALSSSQMPDAWTLAIRYTDGNDQLDGPGNIAFDSDGIAWVNNNYTNSTDDSFVCGSDLVFAFKPNGEQLAGSPYGGISNNGGLYGSGFGISVLLSEARYAGIDETVWVSNFGFQGSECFIDDSDQKELSESISQFDLDGIALSPNRVNHDPATGGWRDGNMLQPQGTAADQDGNMWIANCGNASVTMYPGGDPFMAQNFQNESLLDKPFGIAIDGKGVAWVTSNGNDTVVGIDQDGTVVDAFTNENGEDAVIKLPMGIAVDSFGNKWVSNSDGITTPCAGDTKRELISEQIANARKRPDSASVAMIRPGGKVETFTGGGIFLPWGIAIDGDQKIYVANFGSPKNDSSSTGWDPIGLAVLCGAKPGKCPPGHKTGDPISPDTGYTSNALTRITGIQIDPSGNVVLVNNWTLDAFTEQQNPGGYQIVVFIGLATPVVTPMAGPPRKPK